MGAFPYISAAIFHLVFTLPHFSLTYILSKAFIMFWQNFIRSNSAIFLLIGQIIPLTDQLQSVLLSIVIFFVIVLGVPVYIWGFFPPDLATSENKLESQCLSFIWGYLVSFAGKPCPERAQCRSRPSSSVFFFCLLLLLLLLLLLDSC